MTINTAATDSPSPASAGPGAALSSPSDQPQASWTQTADEYVRLARSVAPVSIITTKNSRFWQLAAWSLFLLSLGRFARRSFLENFASTLGPVQAYPHGWAELPHRLIVHEARHTRQFLLAGWFVPIFGWLGPRARVWAGLLPVALIYGFFPLPVFFAWGRYRLELDADSYSWKVALEQGWMSPDEVRRRASAFAETIASWAYLKAWPTRWTQRAFQRRAEELIRNWERRR
jgi:hypothetical protein